jgi:hypothetical protein
MSAKQRGQEKKALNEAEKERKAAEAEERRLEAEWQVGAKGKSKAEETEAERLEKARRKQEAAAQLAAEEAEASSGRRPAGSKLKKKAYFSFSSVKLNINSKNNFYV